MSIYYQINPFLAFLTLTWDFFIYRSEYQISVTENEELEDCRKSPFFLIRPEDLKAPERAPLGRELVYSGLFITYSYICVTSKHISANRHQIWGNMSYELFFIRKCLQSSQ